MRSILRGARTIFCIVAIVVTIPRTSRANDNPASLPQVSVDETAYQMTLSNNYLELVFNKASRTIVRLAADHTGSHHFGKNLLASDGIRFDAENASPNHTSKVRVEFVERKPEKAVVRLSWEQMLSQHRGTVGEFTTELTLILAASDRGVHIQTIFPSANKSAPSPSVRVALMQWFLLGLFDRGVVQYVAGQHQTFTSRNRLRLFYTMDRENGSVAIEPDNQVDLPETVLLSGSDNSACGIELRARPTQSKADSWISSAMISSSMISPSAIPSPATSSSANPTSAHDPTQKQTIAFRLFANDLPFPAHHAENGIRGDNDVASKNRDNNKEGNNENDNNKDKDKAVRDSTAYFTAIYGSAAGVLGSYAESGSAYPTLATPDRSYGDLFDFFDPDAWSTVAALSYSGDPLLQTEAREILERSESALHPDGQMPHHFENGAPTYLSIAKSSQTGPNIFWVIAASEYAAATGNEAWLRAHYAHLRLATDWVLQKYDPAHHLLRADGPLFIDVFRRNGYTLDTNVMALYLLDRMTEVAEFCGDIKSAERYRSRRRDLYQGIRTQLWDRNNNGSGNNNNNDHFITQLNPDGSTRDLIDYDGNFAALAFGVPDETDARRLLRRLDSGAHTHPAMHGTWVSERRYEVDDCYGGNDGDSDVTMARIWWLDMAARVRLNDQPTFDALLDVVESDLLRDIWMPERYDAAGLPTHNNYYHEYPDILTMVLREMRYGVHVGMRKVTINPFGISNFDLRLGSLRVSYSPDRVSIKIPGSAKRFFMVAGLHPQTRYTLSSGEGLITDADGTLRFQAAAGKLIQIRRPAN